VEFGQVAAARLKPWARLPISITVCTVSSSPPCSELVVWTWVGRDAHFFHRQSFVFLARPHQVVAWCRAARAACEFLQRVALEEAGLHRDSLPREKFPTSEDAARGLLGFMRR